MSERFTPYEPNEATEPAKESKPLSNEGRASMRGEAEPTKPGDLNHPTEGAGLYHTYGDGQGGLVTPEMAEKYHSPENQIEREPYTYRAVPADPAQGASGPADATPTTDPPPPPGSPPPPPGGPPDIPPTRTTAEDEALLKWLREEPQRQQAEAQADIARWDADQRARRPEAIQKSMQGPPDDNYPRLTPDLKLELSNIQEMPLDQRQAAMADLFKREGKTLSNNAIVDGHGVKVKDADGFVWDIRYDA